MIIAQKLQKESRAEYLLYMWQVEGIVRAYSADFDKLREGYLTRFQIEGEVRAQLEEWYANLCRMMREEGKLQSGHLQVVQNVLIGMEDLHQRLLASSIFPYYREMYYKVLPYIVELRSKANAQNSTKEETVSELQMCFEALYGVMMLRLQQKEVSADTQAAAKDISTLLGQLSDYYAKDKQGELKFE